MTDSARATRTTVQIGFLTVDGFMLPDDSYRMTQTQTAEIGGLSERNIRDFLNSKTFKCLSEEDFTPAIFGIKSETRRRGQGLQSVTDLVPAGTGSRWRRSP